MNTIKHKIYAVGDEVCFQCSQNYKGECKAFSIAHTQEEYLFRTKGNGKALCQELILKQMKVKVE